MASTPPSKENVLQNLHDTNATLTEDMQRAALRRAIELDFNLHAGRISIEETLINLTQNRNTIADAIQTKKLNQLPLTLQYDLLAKTQRVAETLQLLVNGADAISVLDEAVEELNATIWQYHLNYLSGHVLGYEQKMNQLKAQEVQLAQATREANTFLSASAQHRERLRELAEAAIAADKHLSTITTTEERATAALDTMTATEQRGNALLATLEQYDGTAAQYLANAKTAAAEANSTTEHINALKPGIEQAKTDLDNLTEENRALITTSTTAMEDLRRDAAELRNTLTSENSTLRATAGEQLTAATDEVKAFITSTNDRLQQASNAQQGVIDGQITTFGKQITDAITATTEKGDAVVKHNEEELKRLTTELATLEDSIRTAIQRATGYTLFHAFQKRQLDLAKSKNWWAIALGITVLTSVGASAYLIHELQNVKALDPVFFLKLSISLPLIYAIAFCSLQYARERRLEEEYAFKSTISISLEPYQQLVEKLVKNAPDEQVKYTAFVIDSITRVFHSPTEHAFEDKPPTDQNASEKLIKALGDFIQPVINAVKK